MVAYLLFYLLPFLLVCLFRPLSPSPHFLSCIPTECDCFPRLLFSCLFFFCTSNIFLLSNYSASLFTLFFIVLFYVYSFVCFVVVLWLLVARPWWITCRQPSVAGMLSWWLAVSVSCVVVVSWWCRVPGAFLLCLFCFVSVPCGAVDVPCSVTPCRAVSHIVSLW